MTRRRAAEAAAPPAPPAPVPPCTTAATQLRYEQPFTTAQKAEEAFYHLPRIMARLDERAQADRFVLAELERLRAQVANATLRASERAEIAAASHRRLDAAVDRLTGLVNALTGQIEGVLRTQDDSILASRLYSAQAIEQLARLSVAVHDLPRDLRTFIALALADQSLGEAEPPAPPVLLIAREHGRGVAAD